MKTGRPHLIGIAGASGAGKSRLAEDLAHRLPSPTPVVGLDSYYRDLAHLPLDARAQANFDAPDALDETLLFGQLEALSQGCAIDKPVYDFTTHTRAPETAHVPPGPFVVVEGLYPFYWERVRALFEFKVFLVVEPQVCLERRRARDILKRGRTPESVETQFRETVYPMYLEYVWPTRVHSDIEVHSEAAPDRVADVVICSIERRFDLEL
jgi:uridine kinase